MKFINSIKDFFATPKVDPVAVASHDAFEAASDAYDVSFSATATYTKRANHRYAILVGDEVVAAYTDPADFEPYTEAYLDAHTAAMDALSVAFDNLTAAFAAFPADALYASAAALYRATCNTYTFAASAYSNAVCCAMITALKGNLQAVKDDWEVSLLEARATNPAEANPVATKAKAAALKTRVAEHATTSKALEQKAKVGEIKAEAFLAKAKSAEAGVVSSVTGP